VLQAQDVETFFQNPLLGFFGFGGVSQEIIASASGSLVATTSNANISNSPTGVNLSGTSVVTFSTPSNTGTSTTTPGPLQADEQVTFAVEGFQQSSTATATSGTF